MTRVRRFLKSGFGLGTLACFVLAGWASWSAGVFDGPPASCLRCDGHAVVCPCGHGGGALIMSIRVEALSRIVKTVQLVRPQSAGARMWRPCVGISSRRPRYR